jgi:hypothetical protein
METAVQPKSPIGAEGRHPSAFLLAYVLAVTAGVVGSNATAQQIVKWTDESGHVHYSDHAPAGHTAVNTVTPSKTPTGNGAAPTTPRDALDPQYRAQQASGAGLASEYDAEQEAAAAQRTSKQQHDSQQQAQQAAHKNADQAVIDRCKADHMLNCKDGADAIRQRDHLAAEIQCTNPAACREVERLWQEQQNSLNPGN